MNLRNQALPPLWGQQCSFDFARPPELEQKELTQRLAQALRAPVQLTLTDNRRVLLSGVCEAGGWRVRLHRMFVCADAALLHAIAAYLQRRCRHAAARIDAHIAAHRHWLKTPAAAPPRLLAQGRVHDLQPILCEVVDGQETVEGVALPRIGWGRAGQAKRRGGRRSIRLGSYCRQHAAIRIHPALDQGWVPRFFVAYVVFHEWLHHVIPAEQTASGWQSHTAHFRQREQAYPDYARALTWQRAHLKRLLRYGLESSSRAFRLM
ncbi:MAG: hypothetical protein ACPGUV_05755 [Polyangiales bacterium]